MSPTERIAVALLGWTYKCEWRGASVFNQGTNEARVVRATGEGWPADRCDTSWPDLTTLDGCRLFEDALRLRGFINGQKGYMNRLREVIDIDDEANVCFFATPAQRVAACLRTLDEAGL